MFQNVVTRVIQNVANGASLLHTTSMNRIWRKNLCVAIAKSHNTLTFPSPCPLNTESSPYTLHTSTHRPWTHSLKLYFFEIWFSFIDCRQWDNASYKESDLDHLFSRTYTYIHIIYVTFYVTWLHMTDCLAFRNKKEPFWSLQLQLGSQKASYREELAIPA